jgi:hypothetical protein
MTLPSSQSVPVLSVTASVLIMIAVLIGRPNVSKTPTASTLTTGVDDRFIHIPDELIHQVQPGMTYAEVFAILGEYRTPDEDGVLYETISLDPDGVGTYSEVTYGKYVVQFYEIDDTFTASEIVTKVMTLSSEDHGQSK